MGVPRLGGYGIRPEDTDAIVAATAVASSTQGNPVELTIEELRTALASAY